MELSHHANEQSAHVGPLIREAVFGIEDGIVSTLGAVVGIAIGTQNHYFVIFSGMVIVAVEALSMAAGSYLSSKSEREIAERYLAEEAWEIEHEPERERKELAGFYRKRGFSTEEVNIIIRRITSNKKLWLEEMAHHELKIFPGDLEKPTRNAWIMGVSYIVGGIIPLFSFLVFSIDVALVSAVIISVVALFGVGAYVTKITKRSWLRSGLEMVAVSVGAAILGFLIGKVGGSLFPL